MANANLALGLRPIRNNLGDGYAPPLRLVNFPSTLASNVFIGDPLVYTGATDAYGVAQVGLATAGSANDVAGAFMGIANGPAGGGANAVSTITRDLPLYRQASIANYGWITDDPNTLFLIQEDSVGGAITAATSAGANANLVAGTGSTYSGYSGWMLDSSTVGTGSTEQLRIVELLRSRDNSIGNYAKWIVRLNTAQLWAATGV